MNDYLRVAKAIEFIEANAQAQPSLVDIADQLSLSAHHVQKLFVRWAGVSPKQFLQALTVEKAKYLLKDEQLSVLDVSEEVGLSSASRLYDHFVTLEAMTPGEYRLSGKAITITYGVAQSPYGEVVIGFSSRGVCEISYCDAESKEVIIQRIKKQWHQAEFTCDNTAAQNQVDIIFHKSNKSSPFKLSVQGTNFQISVWRALLNIPFGSLTSYGEIAESIGRPKAIRAVGSAVGANPISMLIPCHRVIRASGALGGYRGGLTRKKAILMQELAGEEESNS